MTVLARLDRQTEWQATPSVLLGGEKCASWDSKLRPEPSIPFRTCSAFRAHPHLNNILTHISQANWPRLEKSLGRILDMATTGRGPVAT